MKRFDFHFCSEWLSSCAVCMGRLGWNDERMKKKKKKWNEKRYNLHLRFDALDFDFRWILLISTQNIRTFARVCVEWAYAMHWMSFVCDVITRCLPRAPFVCVWLNDFFSSHIHLCSLIFNLQTFSNFRNRWDWKCIDAWSVLTMWLKFI